MIEILNLFCLIIMNISSLSLSLSLFEILYLRYSYGLFRVMQSLRICHGITHKTEFRVDICRWYGRSALIIDAINALVKLSFDFLEAPRWWRVHLDTLTNYITVSFARFAHFLAFPCTNVCVSRNSVPLLQRISSRNLMIGETSVSKIQAMKCTHTDTHRFSSSQTRSFRQGWGIHFSLARDCFWKVKNYFLQLNLKRLI